MHTGQSFTKASVETAYSFFHQKLRVYHFSHINSQRDDIEYAIAEYVGKMNPMLYEALSGGNTNFLKSHASFEDDLQSAVGKLASLLDMPAV